MYKTGFIIWIAMEMSKLRKKIEKRSCIMNTLSSNTIKVNMTQCAFLLDVEASRKCIKEINMNIIYLMHLC